jgi:hypothetical protein
MGSIIGCSDYWNATYCNDYKNQCHGQKGRNASHQTDIEHCLSTDMDICPFSLYVFQDNTGCFLKMTASGGIHPYHPHHYFLRVSTSHLNEEELELQEDMNSARAKIGTKANIHYIHSCSCQGGSPTLLSLAQIAWLYKKKASNSKELVTQVELRHVKYMMFSVSQRIW